MNRIELQQLAEMRVEDAHALLAARRWQAAYYLLGYAVECALKACASRQFREQDVPDRKLVNDFYTHEVDKLLNISGVKAARDTRAGVDDAFQRNWNTVRDWSESSRYDPSTSEAKAHNMNEAVTDATAGVLPWLKTLW